MDKPNLENNQFAVVQAEYSTGIILKKDKTYYKNTESVNVVYEIFESLESAIEHCKLTVQDNSNVECFIVDAQGKTIFTLDPSGERKSL